MHRRFRVTYFSEGRLVTRTIAAITPARLALGLKGRVVIAVEEV